MSRVVWLTPVIAMLMLQCGCSSLPQQFQSLVSRKPDADDPLDSIADAEVTKSYKSAKRELDHSETTLLKFARWREDMGDHAEARTQYRNILADNKDCVDARLGIARVEFATGRVAEAVDILNATARKFPKRAETWAELGRIQSERQEWTAAVQSLTKAYELDPSSQNVRYELGVALARSDRFEEARPHLAFAVGESAALYNIGYVLYESNRREESGHWFRRALNSHPDERTQHAATQMLADLTGDRPLPAYDRQPGQVDVAQTSFEAYRDVPGQPSIGQQTRQRVNGTTAGAVSTVSHTPGAQSFGMTPSSQFERPEAANDFQGAAMVTPQWQGPGNHAGRTTVNSSAQTPVQPQQWGGPSR